MSKDEWFDAACAAWVDAGMLEGTLPLFDAEDRRAEGMGPVEYVHREIELRRKHRVKWIEKWAPFACGDIGHEVDGIKEFWDHLDDPEALRLLRLVWGSDVMNQYGGFPAVLERVAEKGRAFAAIRVYEVRADAFVYSVDVNYVTGGSSGCPNAWSADPVATEAEARAAAFAELRDKLADGPNWTNAEQATRSALLKQIGGRVVKLVAPMFEDPDEDEADEVDSVCPVVGSFQPTLL